MTDSKIFWLTILLTTFISVAPVYAYQTIVRLKENDQNTDGSRADQKESDQNSDDSASDLSSEYVEEK